MLSINSRKQYRAGNLSRRYGSWAIVTISV